MILQYSVGAYCIAILIAGVVNAGAIPVLFIPIVANLLYGSRLHPKIPRLKDIPLMKNLVVAASWGLVTVLMAAGNEQIGILAPIYFMMSQDFINTVLYDIRDSDGDRINGVRTLPVMIGEKKSIILLFIINTTLFPVVMVLSPAARSTAALMLVYIYACIYYFRAKRNTVIMDIFIDGVWLIFSAIFIMHASGITISGCLAWIAEISLCT
jgi:4-hydroxybenzoate polyprenyltransferase